MTNIERYKILDRLVLAEKYFTSPKYKGIVDLAKNLYSDGKYELCVKELVKLPTHEHLLSSLIEKLKGKSVYRTLKKIQEGTAVDSITTIKGLSSLLTHMAIEIEKGNVEYKMLLPLINEKLNELIFRL